MVSSRGVEVNVVVVEEVKVAGWVISKDMEALKMGPELTRRMVLGQL